jgi:uncharacterized protein YabE (DUF348 family)
MQSAYSAGTAKITRWAVLGLVALLVAGGAIAWALKPQSHAISVNGLGNPVSFKTTEQTLGAALKAHGIELNDKDLVQPELATSLAGKKTVTVDVTKAKKVSITLDGKTAEVLTQSLTVADLLKEQSVTLNPKDGVSAELTAQVADGMAIKVTRRSDETRVVREEIPFEEERQEDRNMMVGETKVVQDGASGIKEITQVVHLEDGKEVATEVVGEAVVSDPVNRVVAVGTGGVVSRGGQTYRYSRELTLSSTGYTAGKESNPNGNGYTYTGMRATHGVVAVDPNVIPLYTRLYIEGYGPAIAGDIGGAIRGQRIDLCFDSLGEALDWGRRPVTVYILND